MHKYFPKYLFYFLLATAVLFLSFAFDLFGAMSTDSFLHNFKDSEALVVNEVACGNKLYDNQMLELKSAVSPAVRDQCSASNFKPYSSQYGLQGKIYTFSYHVLSHLVHISPGAFAALAELMTALLSAICFALLILWARVKFGIITGNLFAFLIAISPMIVGFARNLYWALPLAILPFIYVLYFYEGKRARSQSVLFWLGLWFLLYIRYLCGYEYLTTFTIMGMAGVAYYLHLAKSRRRTYLKQLSLVFVVSVMSFEAALGTHIYALQKYTGSTSRAIAIIEARAFARTADTKDYLGYPIVGLKTNLNDTYQISDAYLNFTARAKAPTEKWASLASFINYALLPVVNIPISLNQPFATFGQSLLVFLGLLALLYRKRKSWLAKRYLEQVNALYVGAGVGFIGYLSWMILARPHSLVHAHINGILMYLPFALFGYLIFGLYLQSFIERHRKRPEQPVS